MAIKPFAIESWVDMKYIIIIAAVVLVVVGVGLAILAGTDIPAPSGQVEKAIPADRLPH